MPSWYDSPNQQAIFDFVAAVTEDGGEQFVSEAERIVTFDNDGTRWQISNASDQADTGATRGARR